MIPKIIHYCWFGGNPKPELVERCIASWHACMPGKGEEASGRDGEWEYMEWNEDTLAAYCAANNLQSPIFNIQYCREAYEAKKYAFVSDYVRLWALEKFGGLYMDVDFEVYKSFEPLLDCSEGAFVGREGSKHQPPMLGVMASEAHGSWVTAMMKMYDERRFIISNQQSAINNLQYDMTTNVSYFAAAGVHKPEWVKIYPVEYFCPVLTTGEDVRNENTYCEHKGLHSWSGSGGWIQRVKVFVLGIVSPAMKTKLIKLKRALLG